MATENYTLGRGELFFSTFKSGTRTPDGFRSLGNVPDLTVRVETEKLEHFSSKRGAKEKDLSIVLQTNRNASITAEDVSPENLALFFLGTAGIVSQASASGQTETFNDVIKGRLYQVGLSDANPSGLRSLTTPVLKKGVATLVSGTDYEIDAERGTITILESSVTVSNGDDVTLEFGLAAKSRKQIVSGSATTEGALKFIAYPVTGAPIDYYMPFVEISPNGDLALIGDELMSAPLMIEINTNGDQAAIYADGQPYTAS